MEAYKSKYLHLVFWADEELIEWIWLPETSNMLEREYKQEVLNALDVCLKVFPKKLIGDTRDMFFPIMPALQEWTNQIFFVPVLEIGLNRSAIILSEDLITQLSTEQIMEESEASKFQTRYFDSKEAAKAWILSV